MWFKALVLVVIFFCGSKAEGSVGDRDGHVNSIDNRKNVNPELILTLQEKNAFEKFRTAVYPEMSKIEWSKSFPLLSELYLLRFIRSRNLNVEQAKRDFLQFLDFFRANKLDTILEENWDDMKLDFPVHYTTAKDGSPVPYLLLEEGWNPLEGVLGGKQQRIMRWSYHIVIEILNKLNEVNKKQQNVTQVTILMSMDGFNLRQHACLDCVAIYLRLLTIYEFFIPGFVQQIIVVNAPAPYQVLLEMVRPVLSRDTRKALKVFGTNKSQWIRQLQSRIDPSRLPVEMGGTGQCLDTNC